MYTFLMEWQPEMYGDQEETGEREKFFFDLKEVKGLIKPLKKTSSFREEKSLDDEASSEEKEVEKSWEVSSLWLIHSAFNWVAFLCVGFCYNECIHVFNVNDLLHHRQRIG